MANSSSTDNNMRSDQPGPAAIAADPPGCIPLEFHLIAPCAFFVCVFVLGQHFAAQCNMFWKLYPCVVLVIVLFCIFYAWNLECQSTFWKGVEKTAKVMKTANLFAFASLRRLSCAACILYMSLFSICHAGDFSSNWIPSSSSRTRTEKKCFIQWKLSHAHAPTHYSILSLSHCQTGSQD